MAKKLSDKDKEIEKLNMRIATLEALNEELEDELDELTKEVTELRKGSQKEEDLTQLLEAKLKDRDREDAWRKLRDFQPLIPPPGVDEFFAREYPMDNGPVQMTPKRMKKEIPIKQSVSVSPHNQEVTLAMWYEDRPNTVRNWRTPRRNLTPELLYEACGLLMKELCGVVVDQIAEVFFETYRRELKLKKVYV